MSYFCSFYIFYYDFYISHLMRGIQASQWAPLFYGYCTLCYEYAGSGTIILKVTLQGLQDYDRCIIYIANLA